MAQKRLSRADSGLRPRTVRPLQTERRQKAAERMDTAARAHSHYSKAQALRLFKRVAARSQQPLGKLRAELIPDSSWRHARWCLGPRASQAATRLGHVLSLADHVWGNPADAVEWLNSPHPELDGATPYSTLKSEEGARAVEALLTALDSGLGV